MSHSKKPIRKVVAVGLASVLILPIQLSSAQSPDALNSFGPIVTIEIEGVQGGSHNWIYDVAIGGGALHISSVNSDKSPSQQTVPELAEPAASVVSGCEEKLSVPSKDHRYVAGCVSPAKRDFSRGHYSISITDMTKSTVALSWTPTEWRRIDGIAWSPDSKALVILSHSEYFGKTPGELFFALSGHPIPHDTIYVTVLTPGSGNSNELLVRKDVKYAVAKILRWVE